MSEFTLSLLAGPPIEPITLAGPGPLTVGRSGDCDVLLADPAVSRRHAVLTKIDGGWAIADMRSRYGVRINGNTITPEVPAPLAPGDLVQIGPWKFRVREAGRESTSQRSIVDSCQLAGSRVSRVEPGDLAQRRLGSLMRSAGSIQTAPDETAISRVIAA